jgi:hypothetical protein
MSFPLYDSLTKSIPKKDLSIKQKKDFITDIKIFDQDGIELIYVLTRVYQLQNNNYLDNSNFNLPYGGKFIKDDIQFDLDDFPIPLKRILYKFVSKHKKKMKEEKLLIINR